jgi:hypothetical protein
MMLYFPRPQPDEIIGSLIFRACRETGLSLKRLMTVLCGANRSCGSFASSSSLINPIGRAAGLDPEELLWKHTTFPYVVAFMPSTEVARLRARALLPTPQPGGAIPCTHSITKGLDYRRYCPLCAAEDLTICGTSYWHRSHQLPGTWICTKHHAGLWESAIAVRGTVPICVYDMPNETKGHTRPILLPIEILIDIALRSDTLLNCQPVGNFNWLHHYRELAIAQGYYITAKHQLAARELARDLWQFFGPAALKEAGCLFAPEARSAWPTLMVREGTDVPFIPVKHVLLETFLSRCDKCITFHYRPPGRTPRDPTKLDQTFERRVRAVLAETNPGTRLTVAELLSRARCWQIIRHDRKAYPLTTTAISEFRHTNRAAYRNKR